MYRYRFILVILITILLVSCGSQLPTPEEVPQEEANPSTGPGMHSGMQGRHHAVIPSAYAGKSNANEATNESVGRGEALYSKHCAACHGENGLGEGPAGVNLDPSASPLAHTSQMQSDDYMFWRISEGGAAFETSMPAWKDVLEEGEIWDLVNYTRALGSSQMALVQEYQSEHQDEMLSQAVDQDLIDQGQADTFKKVHDALEGYLAEHPSSSGSMDEREDAALQALIELGAIYLE